MSIENLTQKFNQQKKSGVSKFLFYLKTLYKHKMFSSRKRAQMKENEETPDQLSPEVKGLLDDLQTIKTRVEKHAINSADTSFERYIHDFFKMMTTNIICFYEEFEEDVIATNPTFLLTNRLSNKKAFKNFSNIRKNFNKIIAEKVKIFSEESLKLLKTEINHSSHNTATQKTNYIIQAIQALKYIKSLDKFCGDTQHYKLIKADSQKVITDFILKLFNDSKLSPQDCQKLLSKVKKAAAALEKEDKVFRKLTKDLEIMQTLKSLQEKIIAKINTTALQLNNLVKKLKSKRGKQAQTRNIDKFLSPAQEHNHIKKLLRLERKLNKDLKNYQLIRNSAHFEDSFYNILSEHMQGLKEKVISPLPTTVYLLSDNLQKQNVPLTLKAKLDKIIDDWLEYAQLFFNPVPIKKQAENNSTQSDNRRKLNNIPSPHVSLPLAKDISTLSSSSNHENVLLLSSQEIQQSRTNQEVCHKLTKFMETMRDTQNKNSSAKTLTFIKNLTEIYPQEPLYAEVYQFMKGMNEEHTADFSQYMKDSSTNDKEKRKILQKYHPDTVRNKLPQNIGYSKELKHELLTLLILNYASEFFTALKNSEDKDLDNFYADMQEQLNALFRRSAEQDKELEELGIRMQKLGEEQDKIAQEHIEIRQQHGEIRQGYAEIAQEQAEIAQEQAEIAQEQAEIAQELAKNWSKVESLEAFLSKKFPEFNDFIGDNEKTPTPYPTSAAPSLADSSKTNFNPAFSFAKSNVPPDNHKLILTL